MTDCFRYAYPPGRGKNTTPGLVNVENPGHPTLFDRGPPEAFSAPSSRVTVARPPVGRADGQAGAVRSEQKQVLRCCDHLLTERLFIFSHPSLDHETALTSSRQAGVAPVTSIEGLEVDRVAAVDSGGTPSSPPEDARAIAAVAQREGHSAGVAFPNRNYPDRVVHPYQRGGGHSQDDSGDRLDLGEDDIDGAATDAGDDGDGGDDDDSSENGDNDDLRLAWMAYGLCVMLALCMLGVMSCKAVKALKGLRRNEPVPVLTGAQKRAANRRHKRN